MTPARTPLPIDPALPEIVEAAREHRGLVLVAPPGAGKTTRVPVAIVEAGSLATEHPALVMLQPRRVAARASAQRIAEENGWRMGEEVGYHIRFERRVFHAMFATADQKEGMAAFVDKRKPAFKNG